uniref:Topo IIA-type catalytic domain-containing protein n=1 Tax=Brassica oleracea var. oleracea TaxID=109376 RepID=A0A0D3C4K9_BRAOL
DPLCRLRRTQPSGLHFLSSLPPQSANNGGLVVSGDENNNNGGGEEPRIVPFDLHKEATDSYMAYALSVLLGCALPDVRDGLKPVHRRILFAMHDLGMSSKKPYKKSARVVLGKFHPHGDTTVYDSFVRMAQSFSLRCPLIQGYGNFGSIDADPAAALRYTECRLDVSEFHFFMVLDAYRTGRGRVVVRGKTKVEMLDAKTKRNAVIITEVIF